MKIKYQIALFLNVVALTACSQIPDKNKKLKPEKKQIQERYAPIDFLKSMWNISADTLGRIKAETWYKDIGNRAGNARIYMIHKNGGKWWYEEAKKRFPGTYLYKIASERLLKEDSLTLKDYNKWVFYIDKKYLAPIVSTSGESGEAATDYYPKGNTTIEVILYEQKADSSKWVEIARKKFQTDTDGGNGYEDGGWELAFIQKKLQESNEKK